uniref:adenine phosphoribosyltransferase n=2 Tax=Denticeps clupeoides TaxID=299321 RepID=A0AAY4B3R5_9TELE
MILQTGDFVLEDELSDRAERRGQQRVLRERADAPRTRSRAAEGTSRMDCLSVPAERTEGWYLSLMAPSTKGPKYAWLDPSRLYCNSQALADCVKDLLKPFQDEAIDLVAGIDAMGFILGSAVATTLGRGFLAIRKAGHLCVPTRTREYTDYSGREKTMEVRLDVLRPGLRVLIVDQWIETGGTMKAAIQLVEELGATVAGVAAVAIENSDGGRWIKQRYRHAHCIPERLQEQIDKQDLQTIRTVSGSDR